MTSALTVPRSVDRVLNLLEFVVEQRSTTLTAAASAAELTPTTALRYLRALEARSYLSRTADGAYIIGPTLESISDSVRHSGTATRLATLAQPHLQRLAERTGESAYLAIRRGDHAIYVATHESSKAIRHVGWVGRSVPIKGTAVGEALRGLDGPRFKSSTVEPDVAAGAITVFDGRDAIGAVTVIGPASRFGRSVQPLLARELRTASSGLSDELKRNGKGAA
jgi:DNA-binding IclR family transcriptional regulator